MAKRRRLNPFPLPAAAPPVAASAAPSPGKALLHPALAAAAPPAMAPIARVAGESAAEAALQEVSAAMARARAEGRLVLALPLEAIDESHLVRDRLGLDEEELAPLIASLREHGQRMPVEVAEMPGAEGREAEGRFGLISGWRRLQALRRLRDETGDPRFAQVLALVRRPADAAEAYVAMIEENEIRQGLSYYERARIAARSVDLGVFGSEKQALQRLFAAASRARRSKIGSFLTLYRHLDEGLRFATAIPERLGLALAKALETRPEAAADLREDLRRHPAASPAEEAARLARFAAGRTEETGDPAPDPQPAEISPGIYLQVSGGFTRPVLTLSGPGVDPVFRARLEQWLLSGR